MTPSSPRTVRRQRLPRTIVALLGFVALAGCVRSTTPILTDAKPLLGQTVRFQHYELRDGMARDPDSSDFHWDGTRYVGVAGSSKEPLAFTVFPFEERDFIIQNAPTKNDVPIEYALARKLADGVYLTFLIEENDADAASRDKFCVELDRTVCTIATREALIAFAWATAAKPHDSGGLAIRLADDNADNK